jgi:Tol biopolymer transport system component
MIQHSDLVVRDVHTGDVRVVLRAPDFAAGYYGAVFSPDGSRLAYVRENSPLSKPAGGHALFVASANGGRPRQITPWALDGGDGPDWSPDGKWILFRSYEGGAKQSQIYVVRPNGTGLRALTHFPVPTQLLSASYSPDGKWITVAKTGVGEEPDVFVMRANGTGIRPVTRTRIWDSAPDWGSAR